MNNLVFIEPNRIDAVPFTTSDIIAEFTDNSYRSIQRTIEKHEKRLETFGRVRFEITPFETRGGIQNKKIYHLNEEQATLLIAFLKNTDIVADFKTELVRQFYLMRAELYTRQGYRLQLKPIRREMTDAIQSVPDVSKWAYKQYTDLAYKSTLGKNASQLRKERGASKNDAAIDYMTADEIFAVSKAQNHITTLIELGMDYQQIKSMLIERLLLGRVA